MRNIDQLLDAIKARHSITSDYKLAAYLGLGDANIRNYRHGRSLPDARTCERLAEALGEDPLPLIAEMESQRSGTGEAARIWRQMAERLRSVPTAKFAVMFALVLVAQFLSGTDAAAAGVLLLSSVDNAIIVSICLLVAVAHRTLATTFYALRPRLFRAHADT